MKTAIILAIAALATFGTANTAEARSRHHSSKVYISGYMSCGTPVYRERYFVGYDHCGQPIWRTRAVRHHHPRMAPPRYVAPPRYHGPRRGHGHGHGHVVIQGSFYR